MQLTILGSGSAIPDGERIQSGYLIDSDEQPVLIDCGSGVLHRLAQSSVSLTDITHLLLTHHHLDHVADLLPFLKARWLVDASPLEIYGPPGTTALVEKWVESFSYLGDCVSFSVTEIDTGSCEIGSYSVRSVETIHSMQCYAYRITRDEWSVTISGDTEASRAVADLADGSTILIHDCAFPDDMELSNHPTPRSLAAVLEPISADILVITHLYPMTAGKETEMCATIEERFDGEVVVASDLQTFTV